jgi:hypothetical protein
LFLTTPVTGSGTLEADSGSSIIANGPISAGETIVLNSGHLQFGNAGITNPAMQFLGKIVGESASSTINVDGAYGTSLSFKPISAAGAGLGELDVFNASHVQVADMLMVGHFQQADFSVTPVLGASQSPSASDAWTGISFTNYANSASLAHS